MVTLLGPTQIRQLAQHAGVHPTKTLGQNFVVDPGIVRKIATLAQLDPTQWVLEIGPGLGSLTLALLETGARVSVVEIDQRLAELLPSTLAANAPESSVHIVHKDALQLDYTDVVVPRDDGKTYAGKTEGETAASPTHLVANLPYNVSVPVLMHILAEFPHLNRIVVMVQKEVADRLCADSGSKIYGIPSVKARFFGQLHRSFLVDRKVFWPIPHVDSALVVFTRYAQAPWDTSPSARIRVFRCIDAAFSARRKVLRQSLAAWAGSAAEAEKILLAAHIDPTKRAENLTVSDYVRLANAHDQIQNNAACVLRSSEGSL